MASVESATLHDSYPEHSAASNEPDASSTTEIQPKTSIITTIHLEQIDRNTFRSRELWTPKGARGVFGGQVIGQALWAAGRTIGTEPIAAGKGKGKSKEQESAGDAGSWTLHSMHCYFILPADASIPIIYRVSRLRDGRSYATRSIEASQDSTPIFNLSCSYINMPPPALRIAQPTYHERMPEGVPGPDRCELEEDRWERLLRKKDSQWSDGAKRGLRSYIEERKSSPIAIKEVPQSATMIFFEGETKREMKRNERMLWMKTREDLYAEDGGMQKCILAFLSDLMFVGTAAHSVGLSHLSKPRLGMLASLDHTVYFYSASFSTSKWLLHVITSPVTADGRGVVQGRFYNEEGELLAITVQEGVIRAATGGAIQSKAQL